MSYSLIAHVGAGGSPTSVTSTPINTSGADIIVAAVASFASATGWTFSDSLGNTWLTAVSFNSSGFNGLTIFYCQSPTVGSSHTFSVAGAPTYPSVAVIAMSGSKASPLDKNASFNSGGAAVSGVACSGSTVTPAFDNELVVCAVSLGGSYSSLAVDSSLAITDQVAYSSAQHWGIAMAWIAEGMATGINAAWSWTTAQTAVGGIATFQASSAISQIFGATVLDGLSTSGPKQFTRL